MAWLGTAAGSPSTLFVQSTVPYVRTGGVRVADDYGDLTDGSLQAQSTWTSSASPHPSRWPSPGSALQNGPVGTDRET